MAHVAYESMLRPVVRLFMHPCPGNRVVIGRAVVYYARTAHAYSAGIKCRHCTYLIQNLIWAVCLKYEAKPSSIIFSKMVKLYHSSIIKGT